MLYTSLRSQYSSLKKKPYHLRNIKKTFGITLIELMVSTGLASLLTAIAIPNFSDFIVQLRVDNEISTLSRLLFSARNHAINNGHNVIVCPLKTDGSCTTQWHNELSVFIDLNNNQRFDSNNNEILIRTKPAIFADDILIYGKHRTKITYQPTGQLYGLSNGTLKYCPKGFSDKSRGIVIARSGRLYATSDNNLDGIDETRSNNIISCE